MTQLSRGLEPAFLVAAGELGFCSAAWLFLRELASSGGAGGADSDARVHALRNELGRAFPVLDAVAAQWLAGQHEPDLRVEPVVAACAGADTILISSLEADFLDALLPRLGGRRVVLLRYSSLGDVDWERVLSNYGDQVESTDLASFQRWAGTRTAVLTMVYGADSHAAHVHPAWLRMSGEDVRTQFRSFIGWDVLRAPMAVYPRWLVEVPRTDFTVVV
ncbi:MAG: hypothetical protein U1A78_30115 [Polyangia bacterium]